MLKANSSQEQHDDDKESNSSEDEQDFMSDAFLAQAESSSKVKDKIETYSEKRRKQVNESRDRGKTVNRAQREIEARKAGLSRHLFGELEDDVLDSFSRRKRKDHDDNSASAPSASSSSSNKALKMMMAMGYQQGRGLGRREEGSEDDEDEHKSTAIVEPLPLDDRWLGSKARAGIGRMSAHSAQALSQDIIKASEKEQEIKTTISAEEQYRKRNREAHSLRHWEKLLVDARKTCEDLDTALGVKVWLRFLVILIHY